MSAAEGSTGRLGKSQRQSPGGQGGRCLPIRTGVWLALESFVLCTNKEKCAIQKIENRLKQKNLIMYQVGDKTSGGKALFPVT